MHRKPAPIGVATTTGRASVLALPKLVVRVIKAIGRAIVLARSA